MPSGYATRRRWRETLGDDVVLQMNAARSPRAAGGASDVDCEERHTKRGRWSQSSAKVSRSRGQFGRGRGQHSCAGTCPKGLGYTTAYACCCRSVGILNVILAVAPRHRLKPRQRGHECAASVSIVAYTSALSSVRTYDVRGAGAREKVCCLPQDGVQRVGPRGPLRRIGRSHGVVSLIERPV